MDCRTVGYSANPYANSLFGFDLLFEEYTDFIAHESIFPAGLSPYEYYERADKRNWRQKVNLLQACLSHEYPGRSLLNTLWSVAGVDLSERPLPKFTDDGAKAITGAASEVGSGLEPFFCFINYMDAHIPLRNTIHFDDNVHSVPNTWTSDDIHKWEVNKDGVWTEEFFEQYRALYAAAIDYLDRQVINLVDAVNAQTDRETTVVVTADHGHNLGFPSENRLIHHDGSASEGVLHVPLEIINPPEGYPECVEGLFSHLSLGNLITNLHAEEQWDVGLVQKEIPAEVIGLGGTGDPRDYREFAEGEYEHWNRIIRCVYRNGEQSEKLQWDSLNNQYRYQLASEKPCWQNKLDDTFSRQQIEKRHFNMSIDKIEDLTPTDDETGHSDGIVAERLRSLGYS
jgi:hypothetical protein